ncbi:MAG: FecR domain-containing protein [Deltaproteobacteria bacterium]|nr:FecR domain-containing protein [Deltaproteobacteria bacterium]
MTELCIELRAAMFSYLQGSLVGLEKARLEGHLSGCERCRMLRDTLGRGLRAAQEHQGELEPEHLKRLLARLSPYVEAQTVRERRHDLAWSGVGVAVTALAVLAIVWGIRRFEAADAVATTPAPSPAVAVAPPTLLEPSGAVGVVELNPTPFVRLIAASGWDGQVQVAGRRVVVAMSKGFVAASFVGGHGRTLRVATPNAAVDVVGTRFLVAAGPQGATTIAVAEGRLRVRVGVRVWQVGDGEQHAYGADGEELALVAAPGLGHLDAAALLAHHAPAKRPERPGPPPRSDQGSEAEAGVFPDVLEQLEHAERLADRGQPDAAFTIYDSCVSDAAEAYAPYRQLCRLEMARLLGFRLGKIERARDSFRRLAGDTTTEVGRQATLALCELDLATNPCRAVACLERIDADLTHPPELRREAVRLSGQWRVGAGGCENKGRD